MERSGRAMVKITKALQTGVATSLLLLCPLLSWAQCAPGIPSAGNPGCIPPDQDNSPYNQSATARPVQPAAVWEDRWGAIAMDYAANAGSTTGARSEREASDKALQNCANAGGSHCDIVLTYHNQCAAIAQPVTGGGMGISHGPSTDVADSIALKECGEGKQCKIVYRACSMAERAR